MVSTALIFAMCHAAPADVRATPGAAVQKEAEPSGEVAPEGWKSKLWDAATELKILVWTGASAGAAPQVTFGAGGMPQLGLSARVLGGFVEPGMTIGYGAYGAYGYGGFGYSKLRVSIGTKLIMNIDDVRPYLFVGYSHIHETKFVDIIKDPIGTTLTTAKTVGHRSGAELGVGLLLPVDVPLGPLGGHLRLDTYLKGTAMVVPRLDTWLGIGGPMPIPHDGYLLVEAGVGIPVLG